MAKAKNRLYRSRTNRILGGVVGGLAEYLDMDTSVLRLLWILIVVFTGFIPGIIAYILAMAVIPPEGSVSR